jgi:hypothetical protein
VWPGVQLLGVHRNVGELTTDGTSMRKTQQHKLQPETAGRDPLAVALQAAADRCDDPALTEWAARLLAGDRGSKIGERQGQRTDLPNGKPQPPGNCPEVKPGQETREVAPKAAGRRGRARHRARDRDG